MLLTTLAVAALFTSPAAAPEAPALANTTIVEGHGKIAWFTGTYEEALAKAKAENKIVFIDFWTTWCGWCKKLDKDTYSDDTVVATMKDIICLNIDAESKTGAPIAAKFKISGYPALFFLNSDGTVRDQVAGYLPPDKFKSKVELVRADKGTVGELRRAVAADPKNIDARWKLIQKLNEMSDEKAADAEKAEIKKLDPEGKSLPVHLMAFDDVLDRVNALWDAKKFSDVPALIQEFLAKETYPEVQFRCWNVLGQIYGGLAQAAGSEGNADEAKKQSTESRKAQMQAWNVVPDSDVVGFGHRIAAELYANANDLSAEDKAFALTVATKLAEKAPSDADVLETVACVQFMNGKKDDAQKTVRRCIELDPKNDQYKDRLKEFGG